MSAVTSATAMTMRSMRRWSRGLADRPNGPIAPSEESDRNYQSIIRDLAPGFPSTRQHVGAHMGQNHPLDAEIGQMPGERGEIEMVLDRLVVKIGLGNEQIGPLCGLVQAFDPFGVARIAQHLSVHRQAQCEGGRATSVLYDIGRDHDSIDIMSDAGFQFANINRKMTPSLGRAGKEVFHCSHQSTAQPRWSRDGQRRGASADKLRIKDEEWKPTKMIAMEMGDQDGAHRVGIDPELADGNHRRRPTIDEECTL